MKNEIAAGNQSRSRLWLIVCAAALAVVFTLSLLQSAYADVTPPPVPDNLQIEAGNKAFLIGHAVGTQNYICLPSGTGVKFTLFTPQATLFNDEREAVTTHFFSPNPDEGGVIRATWQHSKDTSSVWAKVEDGHASTDPRFVKPDAVAWLKLTVKGVEDGPTGGDKLSKTTFIQRVNTAGGLAPATGCTSAADIGKQEFVPYTADYVFYKKAGSGDQDND